MLFIGDASGACIRPSPTSPRMLEERLLMRPWLETQLSAVTVPGLHWLNQERNLARIPWLHASRTSYHMDTDSCLFMLWAKHTGTRCCCGDFIQFRFCFFLWSNDVFSWLKFWHFQMKSALFKHHISQKHESGVFTIKYNVMWTTLKIEVKICYLKKLHR